MDRRYAIVALSFVAVMAHSPAIAAAAVAGVVHIVLRR